ncbi:MAG: hypothetical protein CVU23_11520 [Betaproteobacteria bacterium HGW-Betaproteobacteria-17]|nr:MAG: hypothetical protein CVU23_11520 [Betaproteobacteria bacterium HGW-Betaproteobacteria-17]
MRIRFLAVFGIVLSALLLSVPVTRAAEIQAQPVAQTQTGVYKMAIDRAVSLSEAAESMRLRANALNLQLVAELPLSKQVEAVTGKPQRTITIFQFCDAVTAKELIDMSMDFAVYMPCRIALIEDADGQGWLVMTDIDVDMVAKEKQLQEALTARIKAVRDALIEIMQAGAKGEL